MAHKKKRDARVPPANQPQAGPAGAIETRQPAVGGGAPFQNQDPKRRLGGFQTAGEHALQQPSPLNDGTRRSK